MQTQHNYSTQPNYPAIPPLSTMTVDEMKLKEQQRDMVNHLKSKVSEESDQLTQQQQQEQQQHQQQQTPNDERTNELKFSKNTEIKEFLDTPEYKQDFEDFTKMNLIDDKEYMDGKYEYGASLEKDPKITASLLLNFYLDKYPTLFDQYLGLNIYITLVIISVLNNSYAKFLDIFSTCKSDIVFRQRKPLNLKTKFAQYRRTQT